MARVEVHSKTNIMAQCAFRYSSTARSALPFVPSALKNIQSWTISWRTGKSESFIKVYYARVIQRGYLDNTAALGFSAPHVLNITQAAYESEWKGTHHFVAHCRVIRCHNDFSNTHSTHEWAWPCLSVKKNRSEWALLSPENKPTRDL